MTQGTPSLYWVFTLNNYKYIEQPYKKLFKIFKYLVYQGEVGESGTEHLQGYVVLKNRMRLTALKKCLPTAHWEPRRGTHTQAKDYCKKSENPTTPNYEYGDDSDVPDKPGQRTDILDLKVSLDNKVPISQISQLHFGCFLRYERGINSYRNIHSEHRSFKDGEKPIVKIYWGPSGTGKSTKAMRDYPGAYWLTKPTTKTGEVWWQDYSSETVVVFDEFYSWIPYDLLLRILDYYPTVVPIKNGSAKLAAKTFVFTSNQNPRDWYNKVIDRTALHRRLSEFAEIVYMDGRPVEPTVDFRLEIPEL